MRHPLVAGVVHTVLLATCLACGGSSADQRPSTPGGAGRFRVALLHPGPTSDHSWNQGAYEGLQRIRDSLGAEVSNIQTRAPAEFDENFRQYGAQGYDLVFGHGFEFQDAAKRVAPEFPKTTYVTVSGSTVGPNLAGIRFAFAEPSYQAGLIAGAMTKSNVLGAIGGTELPPVKESFVAFEAGARAANPGVKVLVSFVGNWDDVSAGKEQALAQISRGADVIFQNADAAGLGVFQAAKESNGVRVIGSNSDQNDVAPEITLASVVIDLPHAFLTVARELKEQRFTPRVIALGAKDDVVRLVLNPALRGTIPAPTLAMVDSVGRGFKAGTLTAPVGGAAPGGTTSGGSAGGAPAGRSAP
jgi:basic membrane lipoprotein Med (substrate-binding protein (PBP1-ABC) superfamily)